jgi:histidinol-phosphatase (PHP family)
MTEWSDKGKPNLLLSLDRKKDLFHVHTYRCRHAGEWSDESYIEEAVRLGYRSIWFSDHSPFPGDALRSRMRMEELSEYLSSLTALREKYAEACEVHIGLEAEYLPSFAKEGYYEKLKENPQIEFLLLGQHLAETGSGYSFDLPSEERARQEHDLLGEAILAGMESGYFDAVAHPDRIFRLYSSHTISREAAAECFADNVVAAAASSGIPLELNAHSLGSRDLFRPEFWQRVPASVPVICGLDVHSPLQISRRKDRLDDFFDRWEVKIRSGYSEFSDKEGHER